MHLSAAAITNVAGNYRLQRRRSNATKAIFRLRARTIQFIAKAEGMPLFSSQKAKCTQAVQVDREALVTEVHANGSFELQLYVHSQSHNNKNSLKLRHNVQQPIPITYILFVI